MTWSSPNFRAPKWMDLERLKWTVQTGECIRSQGTKVDGLEEVKVWNGFRHKFDMDNRFFFGKFESKFRNSSQNWKIKVQLAIWKVYVEIGKLKSSLESSSQNLKIRIKIGKFESKLESSNQNWKIWVEFGKFKSNLESSSRNWKIRVKIG